MAKTQLQYERRLSVIETKMDDHCRSNDEHFNRVESQIDVITKKLDDALDNKANKDEFIFWRNILVSGIIISIFLGVLTLILGKMIK